jgi:hypothetical protein
MSDPNSKKNDEPDQNANPSTPGHDTAATSSEPQAKGEQKDVNKLSPEEQMALYEEDLKENDWGHQPC